MGRRTSRGILAALCAFSVTLLAACGGPPKVLAGLWSASPEACAAGLGVTFRADAVRARYDRDAFILFAQPRYSTVQTPSGAIVRINYALPGADEALGRGEIELAWSRNDARLLPLRRRFVDLLTGSTTVPLQADAVDRALALKRCPKNPKPEAGPA